MKDDYACEQAQLVTRRGGPDISCSSELGSERCREMYAHLKIVGLPAFDAEDDLLKTPASVFTKIQFGGLLGLMKVLAEDESNNVKVDNIYQLLAKVERQYDSFSDIPHSDVVDSMVKFKIKRKKIRLIKN